MIDTKILRERLADFKKAAEQKGISLDFDRLVELLDRRAALLQQIEEKNHAKKEAATARDAEAGRQLKTETAALEVDFRALDEEATALLLQVPTIPAPDAPIGKSDADNVEMQRWREIPSFDFAPKNHIELMKDLDLADFERGVKVHGFRGYFLKNEAVLMQQGLLQLGLERMRERGFELHSAPMIVREAALISSGHFPGGRDEAFEIANTEEEAGGQREPKFLAGTAEVALVHKFSNEILDAADLPKKMCGVSSCFRSEVGSYGKDTRGIYRIHEFQKVEMVVLCRADLAESEKLWREMFEAGRSLVEDLGLPHREFAACTGDMGTGKWRMSDLEVWWPSRENGAGGWGESGSCSNLLDWQARRAGIRYRDGAEKKFPFMLNNTMIASPRILGAILENCQQADGSVVVPEILRPFVMKERIERRS